MANHSAAPLSAAEGISTTEIAEKVRTIRNTVIAWRAHYAEVGISGLTDHDRSGRPRRIDHRAIVAAPPYGPHRRSSGSRIGPPGCWASTTPRLPRSSTW